MEQIGSIATKSERGSARWLSWMCGLVVLYIVLVMPNRLEDFHSALFFTIPVEFPIIVLVLILTPPRFQLACRIALTVLLTPMLIFKLTDIAVFFAFARSFNPLVDAIMAPIALETLIQTSGVGAGVLAVALVWFVLSVPGFVLYKAARSIQSYRPQRPLIAAMSALLVVAAFTPAGNTTATLFVRNHAVAMVEGFREAAKFEAELAEDALESIPPEQRLAGLKGTDVILLFIESYGRSALENPSYQSAIRARLEKFEESLGANGFAARSAWLTSSTYGGESYLAHSSFLAGLWVNSQQRYAQLLRSDRRTLISDFRDAGWRTVAVMPQITRPWPEGTFFGYDKIYDATNLGYAGKPFYYMTMADQYALASFQANELGLSDQRPVMAEITLISSHAPWTPVPHLVPWEQVGDGKIFDTARTTDTIEAVWDDPALLRRYYVKSVDYTLETVMSFIATYGRDDMLFIILGDHQPMGFMAESDAREVPIHIVSREPEHLARLGGQWTPGMTPRADSPIEKISNMRALILKGFTPSIDRNSILQANQ